MAFQVFTVGLKEANQSVRAGEVFQNDFRMGAYQGFHRAHALSHWRCQRQCSTGGLLGEPQEKGGKPVREVGLGGLAL